MNPSPLPDASAPRTVVVGVQLPDVSDDAFESSLRELERLADTLGLRVVARVTQKRPAIAAATILGEGKLRELGALTGGSGEVTPFVAPGKRRHASDEAQLDRAARAAPRTRPPTVESDPPASGASTESARTSQEPPATVVLVDHDLTPGQTRNLEKATGAEVLDRSMVILSIFRRHARTREALIQVEIAQLSYMAPRLRETHAGRDRQRGGIGGKGAGESALELDRRRVRDRIAELRQALAVVQREDSTRRNRRLGTEASTVALVGYTNAGKSSLMRALTGDEVYVADRLFATLDTTVRVLKPETRPRILVSDTVGFIKKLPHDLVASFRSTLLEATEADLLLHVVDGSDPSFRDQYRVTREVLGDIGAHNRPSLLVISKADRLTGTEQQRLRAEFPQASVVSVRSAPDVAGLHARVVAHFEQLMREESFLIPYTQQRQLALLHERCRVLEETYVEHGTRVRVRAPAAVLAALRAALLERAG